MKTQYTIKVTADYNDGDYVTYETDVDSDGLLRFKKLAKSLKELGDNHFRETLNRDDIDFIDEMYFGECCDECPVHSIISIKSTLKINWTSIY